MIRKNDGRCECCGLTLDKKGCPCCGGARHRPGFIDRIERGEITDEEAAEAMKFTGRDFEPEDME